MSLRFFFLLLSFFMLHKSTTPKREKKREYSCSFFFFLFAHVYCVILFELPVGRTRGDSRLFSPSFLTVSLKSEEEKRTQNRIFIKVTMRYIFFTFSIINLFELALSRKTLI